MQKAKLWKDKEGRSRAKAEQAHVSTETLKRMLKNNDSQFIALRNDFKDLKDNLSNLTNHTSTATVNNTEIRTLVHDTIYVDANNNEVKAKKISYRDSSGFVTFDATIHGNEFVGDIKIKDSLDVVSFWERPHFLGRKTYHTEIKSANPNTTLVYSKSLKVTKRNKKRKKFLGIF